jgi:hypothetical protein
MKTGDKIKMTSTYLMKQMRFLHRASCGTGEDFVCGSSETSMDLAVRDLHTQIRRRNQVHTIQAVKTATPTKFAIVGYPAPADN